MICLSQTFGGYKNIKNPIHEPYNGHQRESRMCVATFVCILVFFYQLYTAPIISVITLILLHGRRGIVKWDVNKTEPIASRE